MSKFYNKALALFTAAALSLSAVSPIYANDIEIAAETTVETAETTEISVPEEISEPTYTYEIAGLGSVAAASVKTLGASAKYYNYQCISGSVKQNAHVIEADISRGALLLGKSLGNALGERGKITALTDDIESENRLVAAVNADFFSTATGVPMGVFIENGRFVSSSCGSAAIGVSEDGEVFFGSVGESIVMTHGDTEREITYLNKYPTIYAAYLLTRDFGGTTRLAENVVSTEYIIELEGDIKLGASVNGEIREVRKGVSNGEIPENCAVLVIPDLYAKSADYAALAEGDSISIKAEAAPEFENVQSAVGGGDIILHDGEVVDYINDDAIETARHPRTAVGVTADGGIVLMVVDGRKPAVSSGVRLSALAEAMRSLGCVSAINLDGGGSSIMAYFTADGAAIANNPSDGTERRVPNALVLYENRESASGLHTFEITAESDLVFSGASLPLEMAVYNADGEAVDMAFGEENVVFYTDELFGRVEFTCGVPHFIAADADGVGIVRAQTFVDGETVTADLFLNVTSSIDTLEVDQSIILASADAAEVLNVRAIKGGKEVYFGEMLTADIDNEDFTLIVDGKTVSVSLFDISEPEIEESEEAEITEEVPEEIILPESAVGMLEVSLADKSVKIPAFFDNALSLELSELIAESLFVENEGYTLNFDGGVFRVESPIVVEETTAEVSETEQVPAETAETFAETVEETAEIVFETIETAEETSTPEETTVFEETTTTEETTVPDETAPEETAVSEELTEPEPQPFEVKIGANSGALVSNGLAGRRIWLWVEGITPDANPYATFEVTKDGETEEITVYYDKYYDFSAYNGKALLTLSVGAEQGLISLKTLLGYTVTEDKSIDFYSVMLAEELDTNLYVDTAEHWSGYYVNSLSYMGIVNGSENLFGELVFTPDGGLSREQFAKILVNYLRINPDDYSEVEITFADNDEIATWAVPFVRAAVGAGLMRGRSTPADTVIFAPRDGITRQEALYVLGGLLGDVEGEPLEFTDSDKIAPWAAENLEKALAAGLISGYDDGSVRPEGGITRAEAATVVVRLYNFSSKS